MYIDAIRIKIEIKCTIVEVDMGHHNLSYMYELQPCTKDVDESAQCFLY